MGNINVKGSARIFSNRYLELLTRTHPLVIVSMYIPVCGYLLWYFHVNIHPSVGLMLGIFFLGIFSWTLAEYLLHRYIFHYIDESAWSKKFHYLVHGIHHDYPKDKQRLVMPPLPSIGLAIFFFGIFWLLMHTYTFAFFAGFLLGYLSYAMIHYATHAFRPPKNFFKIIWEHHSKHHYRSPEKAFGVSSPFWDLVFGTMPPKERKQKAMVKSS